MRDCRMCGKSFMSGHGTGTWYCSKRCGDVYRRGGALKRHCAYCATQFEPGITPGSGSKYCKQECMVGAKQQRDRRVSRELRETGIKSDQLRVWRKQNPGAVRSSRRSRRERIGGARLGTGVRYRIWHEFAACPYCAAALTAENKTIDHMDPVALGGLHHESNLIVCCRSCNSRKQDLPFGEWVGKLSGEAGRAVMAIFNAKRVGAGQ